MADAPAGSGSEALPPAVVDLALQSTPEGLTLVRGVLGALSELLAVDPELLDDMKTAISEACNNVVLHAYRGESGQLGVALRVGPDRIEAVVTDEGTGIPSSADPQDGTHGVGLPLINALSDRVAFLDRPAGGTEVRMEFDGQRNGRTLFSAPELIAPEDGWMRRLEGDVVVSLSPVAFLGPVLGRLARALAARARFSLDRFSDVYLVTDAIAAHAAGVAAGARVGFSITTAAQRIEITVGPLRDGSGATLRTTARVREPGSALLLLSDNVQSHPIDGGELLNVVMTDEREVITTPV